MSAEAGMFFGALAATGYFLPFLAVIEISAGFLLLSNRAEETFDTRNFQVPDSVWLTRE